MRAAHMLLAAALLLCGAMRTGAQELAALTRASGSPAVLLVWSADSAATAPVSYNVYRRTPDEATFTRLTATPVAPVTDCPAFRAIIPRDSRYWRALAAACADSTAEGLRLLVDVCSVPFFPPGTDRWRRVQAFVTVSPEVARVLGQSYEDISARSGTTYIYRVMRVIGGVEQPAGGRNEDTVTVGRPDPAPAPANVRTVVGDAMVQVLWNKPDARFAFFNLYRSESAGGPFVRVSDVNISADLTATVDSMVPVGPPSHGFTDFQRYDSLSGRPIPHRVNDADVNGPANGRTYYYSVALTDMLGNEGTRSAVVPGTPRDRTPPAVPQEIIVTAVESQNGFEIKWPKVLRNIHAHRETMGRYKVYRYESGENPRIGATQIGGEVMHPAPADSGAFLSVIDVSPGLRGACGEKTYYYRVEATDAAGNVSARSAAFGSALKDTTPPVPPVGLNAEGREDAVLLKWSLNSDCDINMYLVYRALCDYGDYVPCDSGRIGNGGKDKDKQRLQVGGKPSECGGPFALIGSVTHEEARTLMSSGNPMFADRTIPPGSPLCYAYVVKAQDRSQNISGRLPIPDRAHEVVVCQGLGDRTPPEPAVISGLFARDGGILVEFIGPPVQDLAAYHVYRAGQEEGPYEWAGGIRLTPDRSVPLTERFRPESPGCGLVPMTAPPHVGAGSVLDTVVEPHRVYWYKAVGVDQSGNEASLEKAHAISTFTFASPRAMPAIISIAAEEEPCGIRVTWNPGFSASDLIGFAVFRGAAPAGPFVQVGNVVKADSYLDPAILRNTSYWYRVAFLRKDGSISALSEPREGVHR